MGEYHLNRRVVNEDILPHTSLAKEIEIVRKNNQRLIAIMNNASLTKEEILFYLEKVTGNKLDTSVEVSTPLYTDFGRHIYLGKDVTIEENVTLHDLGGITLEDGVTIGANTIITTVHEKSTSISVKPVYIKENAKVGPNTTILSGVTIGKNAIIAENSIVDRNVPDNVIVAGNPATVMSPKKANSL